MRLQCKWVPSMICSSSPDPRRPSSSWTGHRPWEVEQLVCSSVHDVRSLANCRPAIVRWTTRRRTMMRRMGNRTAWACPTKWVDHHYPPGHCRHRWPMRTTIPAVDLWTGPSRIRTTMIWTCVTLDDGGGDDDVFDGPICDHFHRRRKRTTMNHYCPYFDWTMGERWNWNGRHPSSLDCHCWPGH